MYSTLLYTECIATGHPLLKDGFSGSAQSQKGPKNTRQNVNSYEEKSTSGITVVDGVTE
jgi:hypothetical protein